MALKTRAKRDKVHYIIFYNALHAETVFLTYSPHRPTLILFRVTAGRGTQAAVPPCRESGSTRFSSPYYSHTKSAAQNPVIYFTSKCCWLHRTYYVLNAFFHTFRTEIFVTVHFVLHCDPQGNTARVQKCHKRWPQSPAYY